MKNQNPPETQFAAGLGKGGLTNARRWSIVGLLFAASVINYFDRGTLSVALPMISADFRLGPEVKGVLLSSFFFSYALMQLPMGWFADRFNLRWLYLGAFAIWSLAQGLTGLAAGLGMLILFRILLGIGESIYLPGGTKIVSLIFKPEDRGLPSGIFDCGTRAGLAMGAPITALLIVHYGWRKMFVIVGFAAIFWLIPWLLVFPSTLGGSKGKNPNKEGVRQQTTGRWVTLNRNLVGICLGFFCFDYYWYLLVNWLPDYLVTSRHMTLLHAGVYSALPYIVFGASEPLGGWVADRLVRRGWDETRTRKWIITVAFLTSLLLIPAALTPNATSAIYLIAGASLVGLATANLIVILQCCAPENEVGIWTGFENFAGNVGGILAPVLTGILIKKTGSYLPGFALGPLILITGLLAYWFVVGELKSPETIPSESAMSA
ncbi:MAG TPA: MFS transporter [Terriglobia bacterium]|nr:MFS transporter [Terriglobia bacterium]